jgi:DNA primase small subunit
LGTDKKKEMFLPNPLHPMLTRAYKILEPMFVEQVLPASGHGLLAKEDLWTELLDSLPDAAAQVREHLTPKWASSSCNSTPEEKWFELKKNLEAFLKGSSKSGGAKAAKSMATKERNRLENWPVEVVFRYTYPRLDINVTKTRNHLLKSPFCVHPKTGRVCVPIQPATLDDFDPFCVPTLPQLMKELDDFDEEAAKGRNVENWQKTSLKGYFEPFLKEFLEPLKNDIRRQERSAAEEKAAVVGDF